MTRARSFTAGPRAPRLASIAMLVAAFTLAPATSLCNGALGAQQTAPRPADPAADREAVRRAALDYIEGFYEGDSTKHVRSIRPEFYKYGFYLDPDSAKYRGMQMTWPRALAFSRRVRESKSPASATAPKEVQIFEVNDQTASAKVRAYWGIDYLLLGKYDGKWMISHVMWQSPPPTP